MVVGLPVQPFLRSPRIRQALGTASLVSYLVRAHMASKLGGDFRRLASFGARSLALRCWRFRPQRLLVIRLLPIPGCRLDAVLDGFVRQAPVIHGLLTGARFLSNRLKALLHKDVSLNHNTKGEGGGEKLRHLCFLFLLSPVSLVSAMLLPFFP